MKTASPPAPVHHGIDPAAEMASGQPAVRRPHLRAFPPGGIAWDTQPAKHS